jgi:hypothetical protein
LLIGSAAADEGDSRRDSDSLTSVEDLEEAERRTAADLGTGNSGLERERGIVELIWIAADLCVVNERHCFLCERGNS